MKKFKCYYLIYDCKDKVKKYYITDIMINNRLFVLQLKTTA